MKLEEKLVSLRKAKGLSRMKLAEKMNVSRQAISRWETGAAIPSSENLKYLSDLYSVSLDYLLSDSADAPEQNRRISNEPDGEMVTIIALVVLLAACNQNQGASEQAGEQIKDASEWKKQEIILKNGVPYAMDEQGDSTKLGEAIQPPDEWKDQDLGGRNDASTLNGKPDVQGELVSPTDGWLVLTYTRGDTYVYKSADGGNTWAETNTPDLLYVPDIVGFINKDCLIIAEKLFVGAPVYITRDGGESWEQIEMPDEKAEVKKIEVTDELITMTVEKDAEIWVMKSSDLGESWSTVQSLQ